MNSIRKIAVYGKGGIGKSTIASNLTAALSYMSYNPAQVGCDPKSDSVNTLVSGNFIPTISDNVVKFGVSKQVILESVYRGFNNIIAIEAGGPPPGQGCAGRGVLVALEYLEKYDIFDFFGVDIVIYDVLGDIVCGGFAQPIRQNYAQEVYIVTSAEYMSLYAANNIAQSISSFANQGLNARLAGIIHNKRGVNNEDVIVSEFCKLLKVPLIAAIPRSGLVQESEKQGQTVIEAFDDSKQAEEYFKLALRISKNTFKTVPELVSRNEIIELLAYSESYAGVES